MRPRYLRTLPEVCQVVLLVFVQAKVHYLVLASVDGLDSPYDLRQEHLPLLYQMVKLGRRWAGRASKEDPTLRFRFGFHTVSGFDPGISSEQVVH